MKEYLRVTVEIPSQNVSAALSGTTLRLGDEGNRVRQLQKALADLGYYTGSVDGDFGRATERAVKAFQQQNGLETDGLAGRKTLQALTSGKQAQSTQKPAAATLRQGDSGEEVRALQRALKDLGYPVDAVDGDYGAKTAASVRHFQRVNGLVQDGVAGPQTSTALASGNAKKYDGAGGKITTENLTWFSGGDAALPRGAVFTVKDVATGRTFQVRRWAGVNHADCEPLTRQDTAVMKEIYGGSWSWNRRAILVSYQGHVYAASMNGMPHGTSTLSNGFNGHFCIHFSGSRTHGTDRVDEDHQAAVKRALQAVW